jgi:hypothetical protein
MSNESTVNIGGEDMKVRGLLRKEVKDLKKEGFILSDLRDDNVDDAMDKVFEIVLTKEDIAKIDELPNRESIKVWTAILDLTYGNEVQEKN